MSIASVTQLSDRIPGGISLDDETRAQALLDDVTTLVNAEAQTEWTDADAPDVVVTVCLAAARRAWSNYDGKIAETIGGYSYRVADTAATGVYLTEAEKRLVRRAAGIAEAGVTTVTLNPDFEGTDWVYLSVEGSDKPVPVYPSEWTST